MRVLFKVSGSIAAYKACGVVSALVKEGVEVKVAASESSLEFIGSATWEALSGNKVYTDDFSPTQRLDHIHLNDWADLVVLCPATAHTINRLYQGIGNSVVTTLFLARDTAKPYLVFPAMNPRMWTDLGTRQTLAQVQEKENIHIFEPNEGSMACGHSGSGRLLEDYEILDKILGFRRNKKSILISFGGTREDIDGVRHIGNFSSGATGVSLVNHLRRSFNVTAIAAEDTRNQLEKIPGINRKYFTSSGDLANLLETELSESSLDGVIHLAAVSDYLVDSPLDSKIDSSRETLDLKLVRNIKIISNLREWSKNRDVDIFGFKLTSNQDEKIERSKIEDLFKVSPVDYVVHNRLQEISPSKHSFYVWDKESVIATGETKEELSQFITERLI